MNIHLEKTKTGKMNKLKLFIKGFLGRDQFEIFAFADTNYNQGRKLREKADWMKNITIWYFNFPFRYARAFSLAWHSKLHGKGLRCLIYAFKSSNHFKGWKYRCYRRRVQLPIEEKAEEVER